MGANAAKISLSLPADLVVFLDATAAKEKTSRSAVAARLLQRQADAELEAEMIAGYQACSEENARLAEEFLPAAMEVWPDYE